MSEIESKSFEELASDFCNNPGTSKDGVFHELDVLLSHPDASNYDLDLFHCFVTLTNIPEATKDKKGMHHLLFKKLRINQKENEESWFAIFSKFYYDKDFLDDYLNEFNSDTCSYDFIWKFVDSFSPDIHDKKRANWIKAIYKTHDILFDPLHTKKNDDVELFLTLALEGDETCNSIRGFKESILPSLELTPECANSDFAIAKTTFAHKKTVKQIMASMNSRLQMFKVQFMKSLLVSLNFSEKSIIYDLLIIRKFTAVLVSPDLKSNFTSIFQGFNSLYKQQLLLAISFDTKSHEILSNIKIENRYYEKFASILGVVFAPLFTELTDKDSVVKYSETSKIRNSRMKYEGYDAIMCERINEIFANPVLFERFLNQSTSHLDQKWLRLKLKNWELKEAIKYLSHTLSISTLSFCSFLNSASHIQYFLSHHFVINLTCLFENYFEQYISLDFREATFLHLIKTGINLIKATPPESIKTSDRQKWFHCIASALTSTENDIIEIGLEAAYQEIGTLAPDSFALAPFILRAIEDNMVDKYLPFLISLYSITYYNDVGEFDVNMLNSFAVSNCFNIKKAMAYNKKMIIKEKVVEILTKFIETKPLTDHTLGAASTILFMELGSSSDPINDSIKLLMEKAMTAKLDDISVRTFGMLSERSMEIEERFKGFNDKIKEALLNHLRKSKLSTNAFGILIEAFTDICIRTKSEDFMTDVKSLLNQQEHQTEIRACIDRYKIRINQPLTFVQRPEDPDAVITGSDSMSSVTFKDDGIDVVTKHTAGSQMATITPIYEDYQYPYSKTDLKKYEDVQVKDSSFDDDYLPLLDSFKDDLCDLSSFTFQENDIPSDYTRRLFALKSERPGTPKNDFPKLDVIQQNRALLSLYQSLGSKAHVFPPSSVSKLLISRIFKELPVRECLKIGCLYVKKGQFEQNDILRNSLNETSDEFKSFINGIGWLVDLNEHNWNLGKLDQINLSNGRYHLFFAGERFEAMFHVAPLLPTDPSDQQQIYKKRHIGNDNVHIIFSEHNVDYDAQTITSQFNDAHVIVYKMSADGLYRTFVFTKNADLQTGPLFGDCVLPAFVVPELVRWTAMFADRSTRISTDSVLSGQLLLESFAECHKTK